MLISVPVYAQDASLLQDFNGLAHALRARGVEPSTLDWTSIETACMGYRSAAAPVFNRCRLQKGIDQMLFANHSAGCNDEARAFYPRSSSSPRAVVIEGDTVVTLKEGGIYPSDRAAGRRYIYDRCMTEKGWLHTHDWRMGRRGEDY